jgi:hypothetical protein
VTKVAPLKYHFANIDRDGGVGLSKGEGDGLANDLACSGVVMAFSDLAVGENQGVSNIYYNRGGKDNKE